MQYPQSESERNGNSCTSPDDRSFNQKDNGVTPPPNRYQYYSQLTLRFYNYRSDKMQFNAILAAFALLGAASAQTMYMFTELVSP